MIHSSGLSFNYHSNQFYNCGLYCACCMVSVPRSPGIVKHGSIDADEIFPPKSFIEKIQHFFPSHSKYHQSSKPKKFPSIQLVPNIDQEPGTLQFVPHLAHPEKFICFD